MAGQVPLQGVCDDIPNVRITGRDSPCDHATIARPSRRRLIVLRSREIALGDCRAIAIVEAVRVDDSTGAKRDYCFRRGLQSTLGSVPEDPARL